jgi:HD-like signal output (HDOD) protein
MPRMVPAKKRPLQGMIYLSGLLHNFGYLVISQTFPEHFSAICRYTEANREISHVAIEKHLIGISREQISAWLMQAWKMPDEVCVALRHQQDAHYDGEHAIYANLIHIAMRLLRQHGVSDAPPEQISDALYERCGLERRRCEEIVEKLVKSEDIKMIADQMAI